VEERAEREARNSLRCRSGYPSVDGGCFSVVVAVTAGVSAAAAVATLPLPDVLWWASIRSQVGWGEWKVGSDDVTLARFAGLLSSSGCVS
jgi:hypothetical protein